MITELFRLREDEASLIQLYRTLSVEMQAAVLTMVMMQSAEAIQRADNVVAFAMQIASK